MGEMHKVSTYNAKVEIEKVAVLFGGNSAEREISLQSGQAVLEALHHEGVKAEAIDATGGFLSKLEGFSHVFIALHGRGGEDGTLQGALEILNIPYTGSGVLASALAMDKVRCKQLWQGLNLPTPSFSVIENEGYMHLLEGIDSFPVMVKPAREGSSVGMSRVECAEDLHAAVKLALKYDVVLIEQYITGEEYTVAIVGDEVLPAILLETSRDFYDYTAKYQADDTVYTCPCGLSESDENKLKKIAQDAFRSVGGNGWGRIDFMRDKDGQFYLLEVNTVPGMTSHSLVPMAAKEAGLSFSQLVMKILELSKK